MLNRDGYRKPTRGKPRLLFLAHLLPWPLNGGGQIKSYHTLRILSERFDIVLLSFTRRGDDLEAAHAALNPLVLGLVAVPLSRNPLRDAGTALISLLSGRSFLIARDAASSVMRENVRLLMDGGAYAVLHVDHLQMMAFVPPKNQTGKTRVVLDNHNIEHQIVRRVAEPESEASWAMRRFAAREWPKLRAFEVAACQRADCILTVSSEDAHGLQALDPSPAPKLHPVPIGVDTEYFAPVQGADENATTLLSIGTLYWPPNVAGAQWFCREVLPLIKADVPDVCLHLVGAKPNKAIWELARRDPAHVRVTSSPPDVRPFAQCGAFVVPLQSGSGMRVKILNAFAMQLPVISTTIGAEGIDGAKNGTHLLLADSPRDFAEACVRVLRDRAFAHQIAQAGRDLVEQHYTWDAIGQRLLSVYFCARIDEKADAANE